MFNYGIKTVTIGKINEGRILLRGRNYTRAIQGGYWKCIREILGYIERGILEENIRSKKI